MHQLYVFLWRIFDNKAQRCWENTRKCKVFWCKKCTKSWKIYSRFKDPETGLTKQSYGCRIKNAFGNCKIIRLNFLIVACCTLLSVHCSLHSASLSLLFARFLTVTARTWYFLLIVCYFLVVTNFFFLLGGCYFFSLQDFVVWVITLFVYFTDKQNRWSASRKTKLWCFIS